MGEIWELLLLAEARLRGVREGRARVRDRVGVRIKVRVRVRVRNRVKVGLRGVRESMRAVPLVLLPLLLLAPILRHVGLPVFRGQPVVWRPRRLLLAAQPA